MSTFFLFIDQNILCQDFEEIGFWPLLRVYFALLCFYYNNPFRQPPILNTPIHIPNFWIFEFRFRILSRFSILTSQISPLRQYSHISDFQTCFVNFCLSFRCFFTRVGAKDQALKHATFFFSIGLLVAKIFHFYCSKSVKKHDGHTNIQHT